MSAQCFKVKVDHCGSASKVAPTAKKVSTQNTWLSVVSVRDKRLLTTALTE